MKLLTKNVSHLQKRVPIVPARNSDGLPIKKTHSKTNPLGQIILVVAPPGWGKTEFFGDFPDCLMLCCEQGHKFVEAYKIIVDCWDHKGKVKEPWEDSEGNLHMSFLQAVDRVEQSERFKFVCIDTLDSLVKMILDFYYIQYKVNHAEDIGGYGKGWDIAQNTPFRRAIGRLMKAGRGIGMTTHQQIENRNFKGGQRSKKETTLPGGVWKYLYGQLDIILHGIFGERRKPNKFRDRIVVTEGNEEILAKNRGGKMPPEYICRQGEQWEQFSAFFTKPETVDQEIKAYHRYYE